MEKLIITAAITGAELDPKKCPGLPCSPEEQAIASRDCLNAGASVIHLHVRNDKNEASQELSHFQKATDKIRAVCQTSLNVNPIIQFSTGGAVGEPIQNRIAPLALKPEMASFNLGTINFGEDIFVNTFADMRALRKAFQQYNVIPEYEIYDAGHIDNLKKLIKEGILTAPYHCQFVLGVPGALSGELDGLLYLIQHLPHKSAWAVAGVGRFQLPLAVHAILLGGHVRVGLEDNIYYAKGQLAKSNAQLVERIVRIAHELGREVASPAEARQILGLSHL